MGQDLRVESCSICNDLEKSLSCLYWLQKDQIALSIDFANVLTRYINHTLSYSDMSKQCSYIKERIDTIQVKIEKHKDLMNYSIYKRNQNKKRNVDSYSNRKINNVDIKTFRELSQQLYSHLLPDQCSKCGSKDKLHIHHLRYEYPPQLRDMIRLCAKCHSKHHAKLKRYGVHLK